MNQNIIHNLENSDQIKIIYDEEKIKCLYINHEKEILLAEIDNHMQITKIYPHCTKNGSTSYLTPKYDVNFIFEGYDNDVEERENGIYIISDLPKVFINSIEYGLGLKKEYILIAQLSTYLDNCQSITISKTKETKVDNNIIVINDNDLDKIRRGIDRITNLHRKESFASKKLFLYNELLHNNNSILFPQKKRTGQKDIIYKIIKDTDFSRPISKSDKRSLLNIKDEIELGYFSTMKNEFDKIVNNQHTESSYQRFFEKNSLLLTLFIGSPYMQFNNQAYVGGKSFDNKNGQYPDFLYKHKITNNSFIIEIKCPKTKLLRTTPYRETGIYSSSEELIGSVTQVLTQKYQLETEIATLLKNAEDRNVEAFNVQCFIIIGTLKDLEGDDSKNKKRSFELFRSNQKNLRIITYDECQEQLNNFLQVMKKGLISYE